MPGMKKEELPLTLRFSRSATWVSFIARVLALCIATSGTLSAGAGASRHPSEQTTTDSSSALRTLISDILDALKTKDGRRAEQLIGGLIMENNAPWFAAQFSVETGELLKTAYKQSMKDFVSMTRELYTADILRGPIMVR